MHYHFKDHVYVTQFRNELIILDTVKDKYTICSDWIANFLETILSQHHSESKLSSSKTFDSTQEELIQRLKEQNLIESKEGPYPFHIDRKFNSQGVPHVDWRLPIDDVKVGVNSQVFQALAELSKVNFFMKFRGFHKAIGLLKKELHREREFSIPHPEELTHLAYILNKACLLYPKRTKCLEWAMTFVLLALKRGWQCNLEVGVQNYPFQAHAWVECDGKIVLDEQNLRNGMAIVLQEPFRKVIL